MEENVAGAKGGQSSRSMCKTECHCYQFCQPVLIATCFEQEMVNESISIHVTEVSSDWGLEAIRFGNLNCKFLSFTVFFQTCGVALVDY